MRKLIILIIFLPLLLFSQRGNQSKLSIDDCVNLALKQNNFLKASEAKMLNAQSKYNEAKTYALPSLKLSGSYSRLSEIEPFEVTLPAPINKTLSISPVLLNSTNLKLSLQQPIFTGSKVSGAIDAAEFGFQSTAEEFNRDKIEIITNTKIAFFNILKAEKVRQNISENIEKTNSHIKDINNFLSLGQATKNDLLKIEVQLYNLKASLVEAENLVSLAKLNLKNIIGKKEEFEILNVENDLLTIELNNLEFYIRSATSNRSELKALDKKLSAADAGIKVATSNWYPQIYLNANFLYANPNQRIMPMQDKFKETWDVGIALSFDLWNWGANSDKVDQAKAQYKEIECGLDYLKDNVTLEVTQIYFNLKQIKESIKYQSKAVEQAEENFKISKEKFEKGFLSSSELLDAETALLVSKNNYSNSMIDYMILHTKLMRASGLVQ